MFLPTLLHLVVWKSVETVGREVGLSIVEDLESGVMGLSIGRMVGTGIGSDVLTAAVGFIVSMVANAGAGIGRVVGIAVYRVVVKSAFFFFSVRVSITVRHSRSFKTKTY